MEQSTVSGKRFASASAMRSISRLVKVSRKTQSAPAATPAPICSAKYPAALSGSRSPKGSSITGSGPTSSATLTSASADAAASFAMRTPAATTSPVSMPGTREISTPLAAKVLEHKSVEPAAIYSSATRRTSSGWLRL